MSDLVKPSTTEAAMRKAAMSLPPSDFGSHRAIQAAARAADDLIAPYRARITALEGDADMVDEREMRSNLRIEALEADRLKSKLLLCEAAAIIKALEAALQKVVIQERRVAASTDMTRSAMREGAAELATQIDAALKGGGNE